MVSQRLMLTVPMLFLILPRFGFGADTASYVIEPPDVLRIEVSGLPKKAPMIRGEYLVRPDGTVSLGAYGSVFASGLSLDQTREAITKQLTEHGKKERQLEIRVEVVSYNSKVYYVIAAEQVYRHRLLGDETVVGTVLQVEGLAAAATKGPVRLARAAGNVLDVDWRAITQEGKLATNYKLEAGDRIYVGSWPAN